VFSIGMNQAYLSDRYRANQADAGLPMGSTETGVELTYADEVLPGLQLQPDLQWIRKADRIGARNAFVATLRLNLSL
jgi:porin